MAVVPESDIRYLLAGLEIDNNVNRDWSLDVFFFFKDVQYELVVCSTVGPMKPRDPQLFFVMHI